MVFLVLVVIYAIIGAWVSLQNYELIDEIYNEHLRDLKGFRSIVIKIVSITGIIFVAPIVEIRNFIRSF